LIGEKIPLIRRVTNFGSNQQIWRFIFDDKPVGSGAKSRFSLYFAFRPRGQTL